MAPSNTSVQWRGTVGALCVLACLAAPAAASAADLTVNDDAIGPGPAGSNCGAADHSAIQDAVDAADPGDTILVCAGNYTTGDDGQPAANVSKSLSLLGAKAGVAGPDHGTPGVASDSIVDDSDGGLQITASDVSVDGFHLTGVTDADGLGAGLHVAGDVSDNRFVNNSITGNVIGAYLNNEPGATTVFRRNLVSNNNAPGSSSGAGVYSDTGIDDVEIAANEFSQHTNAGLLLLGGGDLEITNNDSAGDSAFFLVGIDGATIANNRLANSVTHGIQLDGDNSDIAIAGNSIADPGDDTWSAVRVSANSGGPNTGVTVVGNDLTDDGNDFGVRVGDGASSGPVEVHQNRIVGFTAGAVGDDATDPIDAEDNWWGCNAGPNQPGCDTTAGEVTADSWLVLTVSPTKDKIRKGRSTKVKGSLRENSDGDVLSPSLFPDGVDVAFTETKGEVDPATAPTEEGLAKTVFTGRSPGKATITATLDDESADTEVKVKKKKGQG